MYMDDIKQVTKKLETLIEAVRIYSHDIGMELGTENYAMLIMKAVNDKWQKE